MHQKVKNTSPPKNRKHIIKNITKTLSILYNYYSLESSLFDPLGPPLAFPFKLLEPNISSHVKLRVNNAGNMPSPITKPFCLFPKRELP
jgi:hypothetical protein